MNRGIYITANDRVSDQAIALIESIRVYDEQTPIVLIPYDENYHQIAEILNQRYGVTVYADLELVDRLSHRLHQIFGEAFFARPNQFRKQACWFGEFDEFLYIDTDIVVFDKIINYLDYLSDYDFLCCDYQHKGGIANVFTPKVLEAGLFSEADVLDIFNGGLWASKKERLSEEDLYESFAECAAHPEYFDFSQKTSDQPIINYTVLKRIEKRFNLVRRPQGCPGSWAGSPHFQRQENKLIDPKSGLTLEYLHWAGIRIEPGCPYWEIWEHYRYLHDEKPPQVASPKLDFNWREYARKLKQSVKALLS
ncbi:MAG: hypothetical protein SWY16_05890 [Cyanobacteriota bacterium]|nr:hypothetical protein [Cyanobacteriota bacterium]